MKIRKNNDCLILTDKLPLAVSASKRTVKSEDGKNKIKKRFYTYRLTIPRIFLDLIFREKVNHNNLKYNVHPSVNEKFMLIPTRYRKYYFTNYANRINLDLMNVELDSEYSILEKNKDSYKITLPKSSLIELLVIDNYMDTLDNVKDRRPIYLYFKLKICFNLNRMELTFKFNNKFANDETVKLFKRRFIDCNDADLQTYYMGCLKGVVTEIKGSLKNMQYVLSENPELIKKELNEIYIENQNQDITESPIEDSENDLKLEDIKNAIKIFEIKENPWDMIIDKEIIKKINISSIITSDDIMSNNLNKFKDIEELFILFKDVAITTSYDELKKFMKTHYNFNKFEDFISLYLAYKKNLNTKRDNK